MQPAGEELLTGDTKTQVEAAVLAEYLGAAIERTESDSGGVHESHIVTAAGERLTVLVGEDFAVTGTETGALGPRSSGGCQLRPPVPYSTRKEPSSGNTTTWPDRGIHVSDTSTIHFPGVYDSMRRPRYATE